MKKKAIGIDLGGTAVKAGVVDGVGRILSRVEVPTEVKEGRDRVIRNIARAADRARKEADLKWREIGAVGLGSPGVFQLPEGIVHNSPNLKCLEGKKLAGPVAKRLGLPKAAVVLENDANVAAYAESWVGAGRDASSLVMLTLGTGIGGGIVLNNQIWRGAWGAGAELGHQSICADGAPCGCGNRGCVEAYASATALVRRFREAAAAGRRTRLSQAAASGAVTARDICGAAKAGDRLAREMMEETGRLLGVAVVNLLHILNVEMVVFAGGMTAAGALLLTPIRREVRRHAIRLAARGVRILFSRLGNDAGLIGAAGWAMKNAEC